MLFQLQPQAMPDGYGEALIPLPAAKAWVRALHDDEDDLIAALRDAGIDMTERFTSLYLAPRTGLVAEFASFGGTMRLGRGPDATLAVTAVSYVDAAGEAVALEAGDWRMLTGGALAPTIGGRWPVSHGPVTVTFDAGFAAGACPAGLLTAAKLFMGHLYTNREAVAGEGYSGGLPGGFVGMASPWRMPVI